VQDTLRSLYSEHHKCSPKNFQSALFQIVLTTVNCEIIVRMSKG